MKTEQQHHMRQTLSERGVSEQALPMRYLQWLENLIDNAPAIKEQESENASSPFLSVIMRTQGKRYDMLKEVLLCMQGQTDTDFEIILVLHNGDTEGQASVERLLQMQPPEMRGKIRYEVLNGGTRTAPLNLGASLSRGAYIAMLDDDDLVFDNWVENYHRAATKKAGCVIRAYGCTQVWTSRESDGGTPVLRADSTVENRYCRPFDLVAHLSDNNTPISCVAIPTFCYQRLGIRFDDELTTAEDWDFIMRCILTVGVYDTHQLTFVYRLWNGTDSSHTVHQQDEWDSNRRRICDKLDQMPILTNRRQLLQLGTHAPVSAMPIAMSKRPTTFPSLCKQILKLLRDWLVLRLKMKKNLQIISASPLFNAQWYRKRYPDVEAGGMDPARHYLLFGWAEGRDPSLSFTTSRYLMRYPDVAASGICPLLHYETKGRAEGREADAREEELEQKDA